MGGGEQETCVKRVGKTQRGIGGEEHEPELPVGEHSNDNMTVRECPLVSPHQRCLSTSYKSDHIRGLLAEVHGVY